MLGIDAVPDVATMADMQRRFSAMFELKRQSMCFQPAFAARCRVITHDKRAVAVFVNAAGPQPANAPPIDESFKPLVQVVSGTSHSCVLAVRSDN